MFENVMPELGFLKADDIVNSRKDDPNFKSGVFMGHFPHGCSVRSLSHYGQILVADRFQRFDYHNETKHLEEYGQSSPPEIKLSNIKHVPISMFVGKEDQIIDLESN